MSKSIFPTTFFILSLFQFFSSMALADAPNDCPAVRYGKAKVQVSSLRWIQEKGSYRLKSEVVCTEEARLEIHAVRPRSECMTPVLTLCKLTLDGKPHQLTVSGEVRLLDGAEKKKNFSAGYHLDRNSTEVRTGEAANSQILTKDLGLKQLTLEMQSKLDGPGPNMSLRDAVNVSIEFEDTDAP